MPKPRKPPRDAQRPTAPNQTTATQSAAALALQPPRAAAILTPPMLPRGLVARLAAISQPVLLFVNRVEAADLIAGMLLSPSLSLAQKDQILAELPCLSTFQVTELMKVFSDEREAFADLVPAELDIIADLQAKALWATMALLVNRFDVPQPLRQAWLRRTVRRAAANGLRTWLDTLPGPWWRGHAHARWAYRHLYPADHPAWAN